MRTRPFESIRGAVVRLDVAKISVKIVMAALAAIFVFGLAPASVQAQGAEVTPPVDPLDEVSDEGDESVEAEAAADEAAADEAAEEAEEAATAKSNKGIETMVVSARKREDDLQKVPIAVTAFSGQTLEVNRIEDTLDIQFSVPNMLFGKTNFTGSNLQIRGIGNAAVSSTAEPTVGIHVNEVPLTTSRIFEQQFFDIERIEVLRGPQGTLFGRNSTGGSFNIYTRKPTDELAMNAQISAGNYASAKVDGAINIPLGDKVRTRIAGMYHRRNGYIDNLYTGDDIDDRSLYGIRGSIGIDVTDAFTIDAMVSWFDENDSRSRIGKQLCTTDTRPGVFSLGCTDDKPGFENIASYATLGGILENYTLQLLTLPPMNSPGYTLGGPSNPLNTSGANPADYRTHDSRINPQYSANELFADLNLNYEIDQGAFIALFGYQKTDIDTVQDYTMARPAVPWDPAAVATILFVDANAATLTPPIFASCTSAEGNPGIDFPGFGCNDRSFSQDNSVAESDQISGEFRFTSDLDGPVNFTVGTNYTYFSVDTDYYVYFSGAEMLARVWQAVADPTYDVDNLRRFNNESKPAITNSFGLYGEFDWEFLDTWTFTGGARYTNDRKTVRSRNYLLNGLLTGSTSTVPEFQKQEEAWNAGTGRAIIDKSLDLGFTDQSSVFVSYSRGYKPGGFNPPAAAEFPGTAETFKPEFINALEFGSKNRLLENDLQANLSAFFYDYKDYQVSKIVNRTSVNENVDAFVWGFEAEFIYQLIEDFFITMNFAYLGTRIREGTSIDPADPADIANNPGYVVIKRLDNASNIVCPDATCAPVGPEPLPPTYEDGNGNLLAPYLEGFAKNLEGNELPNSPKFSISVGASYTFKLLVPGEFTPRISYYWQSKMYGRLFNSERDEIGSWSQANAGLRWNDDDNRIWADFWIQNFTNNDDITTQYFTDASSGNFTNVFLLEPLTVGGTVGFSF